MRDCVAAFRSLRTLPLCALRLLVGAIFAALALVLVAQLPLDGSRTFGILATLVFLGGLTVDALVGDEIRAGIGL